MRSAYGAYARPRAIEDSRPGCDEEVALGCALAGEELVVTLVDVARDERGAERVGARDEDRRHLADVGREPRRGQRAHELARRDEHLAAEMAALLFRRELVLEMDAGGAGLDEGLHQLEGVQRPAEAGLRIRDDRGEPVAPIVGALRRLDLIRTAKRVVQSTDEGRRARRRVQALIGIDLFRQIGVGCDLPTGQVDGLQAGLDHLYRLAA